MFGRRRKFDRALRERGVPPTVDSQRDDGDREATTGPFDVLDAPDDDDTSRLDLGALRVPTRAGFELRLELTEQAALTGVTLSQSGTDMQLGVFAAPRSGGIWADVRSDIADELARAGAKTAEHESDVGVELHATRKEAGVVYESRFFGVDGPRWFLRGLVAGPLAGDEEGLEEFRSIFRGIIVDRGSEPKPVREPLTLTLPADLAEQAAAQAAAQAGQAEPPSG